MGSRPRPLGGAALASLERAGPAMRPLLTDGVSTTYRRAGHLGRLATCSPLTVIRCGVTRSLF
jgi:hypothetical protein